MRDHKHLVVRRTMLQAPDKHTWLTPGESITLTAGQGRFLENGRYALSPHPEAKKSSHALDWVPTETCTPFNNQITITNRSTQVQKIPAKDYVAETYPLVDPNKFFREMPGQPSESKPEPTWRDVTIDPSGLLHPEVRSEFQKTCENFASVFQSDLPKYNGAFGKVEAVINLPSALPPSARLKEVPWYPKKLLGELQEKFDELDRKGALVRPQDVGINVEAMSPSFLVKKKPPSNGYRLVTSFGSLAAHVRTPPSPMPSTDSILRRMASWKWIITTDISQAYHQIPLSSDSLKYAGVCTPFKGARVYTTAAMGMPGSEVALTELTAALFGQLQRDGKVEILMDDVYVGSDDQETLLLNWRELLEICNKADIRLGPKKVVIAPKTTKILGWIWHQGGHLSPDPHASNRLKECEPPTTAEGLRGWIGAYKFMAPAIPSYATFLEPLNKAVGEKSKSQPIEWDEELREAFQIAKRSLSDATVLTIPPPGEQLYMTTDASKTGIGATLHRTKDKAVVRHFSKQLSSDKKLWLPCELEALAVGAGLASFLPYFRESGCRPIIYTDSTPVVMAYNRIQKGLFSASPRVSTFLHEVINQGAIIKYLSGKNNIPADHASRNAAPCQNQNTCQVCSWVNDKELQVVRQLNAKETDKLLAGNDPLPLRSKDYWKKRQKEDPVLKNVFLCITKGMTPPATKNNGWPEVRRYLLPIHGVYQSGGVLMSPSVQPFTDTPRFVVPRSAAMTVVSIFHQQLNCLKMSPLRDLLRRHFLILNLDDVISKCVKSCYRCAATRDKKHIQPPMSSVTPPSQFGRHFATDVIRREKQKILVLRETATSYTWAKFVPSETAKDLEAGLRCLFALARPPNATQLCVCRCDNASAFKGVVKDISLRDIGVSLDLSNAANKNGNPVAEKANSEMHDAIKSIQPKGGKLSEVALATAVSSLNAKPRWSKMSAVELWTSRDMLTGKHLLFSQDDIINRQHKRRAATHPDNTDPIPSFSPGDIVFSNSEGNKERARESLIVREDLGGDMYRLDRITRGGYTSNITKPAIDLYKPTTEPSQLNSPPQRPPKNITLAKPLTQMHPTTTIAKPLPVRQSKQPITTTQTKPLWRPCAPAPGRAADYNPEKIYMPFIFPADNSETTPSNTRDADTVSDLDDFHSPGGDFNDDDMPPTSMSEAQGSDMDVSEEEPSTDQVPPPPQEMPVYAPSGRAPLSTTRDDVIDTPLTPAATDEVFDPEPTPPVVNPFAELLQNANQQPSASSTSRFGRRLIRPATLVYNEHFKQMATRQPPQSFRLPGPAVVQQRQPPDEAASPPDRSTNTKPPELNPIKKQHSDGKKEGWKKERARLKEKKMTTPQQTQDVLYKKATRDTGRKRRETTT